jgi:hypothetical protein
MAATRKEGEIVSGGQVSSGGTYTLKSQVGHAIRPQTLTGGAYALHWNASVIPW